MCFCGYQYQNLLLVHCKFYLSSNFEVTFARAETPITVASMLGKYTHSISLGSVTKGKKSLVKEPSERKSVISDDINT